MLKTWEKFLKMAKDLPAEGFLVVAAKGVIIGMIEGVLEDLKTKPFKDLRR